MLVAFVLALASRPFFLGRRPIKRKKKTRPARSRPTSGRRSTSCSVEYRSAGNDVEKKQAVCDKVLEIGPAASPAAMLAAVNRDLQPKIKKYNAKFQAQAAAASNRKTGKVDLNEVMESARMASSICKSWATN